MRAILLINHLQIYTRVNWKKLLNTSYLLSRYVEEKNEI
mgnify:FL=1